jgi:SAM-dependent methyltransferase
VFEPDARDETKTKDDCGAMAVLCPVCGSPCHDHTTENLTSCETCRHVFQTDLTVTMCYDAGYAHQYDHRPVKEMSRLRWDFIQSYLGLSHGSRILDVGYGNGAFLKHARAAGMAIHGIDLHAEDFDVPVVDFATPLEFDLICFFDSLEHFPSFEPVLGLKARNVVVSVPNPPGCLLTAPRSWRHFKPGEHLHYFSRNSLDALMRNWGFATRFADGYPEDDLRGKLVIDGQTCDNIYTAIYTRS